MKFSIYQSSRKGPRAHNQDRLAYAYSRDAVLMVLADGMGGHRHGEVAARLAVRTLTEDFKKRAIDLLPHPGHYLMEQIQLIHQGLHQLKKSQHLLEAPCTTIVAAIIQQHRLYTAHVGDSRLYHFRSGRNIYHTEDHSVVQKLFRQGLLHRDEMARHPERHKIYNCLGSSHAPKIELTPPRKLMDGDILLLCSDGLWSGLSEEQMAAMIYQHPVDIAIPKMLETAEEQNGSEGDNASAIGLRLGQAELMLSSNDMAIGAITTMLNPVTENSGPAEDIELSEAQIDLAIAEIQAAISKSRG